MCFGVAVQRHRFSFFRALARIGSYIQAIIKNIKHMIKDPFEFPGLVIHHNLSAAKHIIAEVEQDRILIDKCLEQVGQDLQYAVLDSEKDQIIEDIVKLNMHAATCEFMIESVKQFVNEYYHNLN